MPLRILQIEIVEVDAPVRLLFHEPEHDIQEDPNPADRDRR